jgi:hypothetical protein
MNPIKAAINSVAEDICEVLEKVSSEEMLNRNIQISDRLIMIKSALYLRHFLINCLNYDDDEDWDLMKLIPFLIDYNDEWALEYDEFAEKFVPWAEAEGAENW